MQESLIQPETLMDWRLLCEQAVAERDPAKFLTIIRQLNEIFRVLEKAQPQGNELQGTDGSKDRSTAA